jgi:hypothetical protein
MAMTNPLFGQASQQIWSIGWPASGVVRFSGCVVENISAMTMIRADTTARPAFASITMGPWRSGCGSSSAMWAAVSKRHIVRTPGMIHRENTTTLESQPVSFRTFKNAVLGDAFGCVLASKVMKMKIAAALRKITINEVMAGRARIRVVLKRTAKRNTAITRRYICHLGGFPLK